MIMNIYMTSPICSSRGQSIDSRPEATGRLPEPAHAFRLKYTLPQGYPEGLSATPVRVYDKSEQQRASLGLLTGPAWLASTHSRRQ